jgi:signal peptidase I
MEPRTAWRRWGKPLLMGLLVWCAVEALIAEPIQVRGSSMRPTLLPGDRLLLNKLAYGLRLPGTTRWLLRWGAPRRGEVVVLLMPGDGRSLVKRVVGVPGDTLEVDGAPLRVPDGTVFVMGDNRGESFDSRAFGCVEARCVFGRAAGVLLSIDPADHLPRRDRWGIGVPTPPDHTAATNAAKKVCLPFLASVSPCK